MRFRNRKRGVENGVCHQQAPAAPAFFFPSLLKAQILSYKNYLNPAWGLTEPGGNNEQTD
jgi:hypothetical protein